MPASIQTIGHSNHSADHFLHLLKSHRIEVVVDTRSQPYSNYATHFDQSPLKQSLTQNDIQYLYLGRELGGRPEGDQNYDSKGHVLYHRVAESADAYSPCDSNPKAPLSRAATAASRK